jgi:ubiquinone biosynthesis protein UbiJ
MIDQLAAGAAVAVLNRMLAREAWARSRLAPYAGRVALFQAAPFSLRMRVRDGGTFETVPQTFAATDAGGDTAASPHVTIGVDIAALPNVVLDPRALMRNVRLTGDAEFAQALSDVLQNLRPEPEEELAPFFGDVAAVRLVGFLRAALAQAQEGAQRLSATAADYFVAENPMLATRADIEGFSRDVTRLRDDVERLAKRIDALAR